MASICGFRATSILAEIEVEPNAVAVIIKKEEVAKGEEKVDAFGRLIGRKAVVLESKRRTKCIEGLGDRELKRRKRLQQWCVKLDIHAVPSADFHSDRKIKSITTSTDRQSIGIIGNLDIPKIKQEAGSSSLEINDNSRVPEIPIKLEFKHGNEIQNKENKNRSQDNEVLVGVKRGHSNAVVEQRDLVNDREGDGREDELDQYYNPKKPSRAGLGMGGLGSSSSSSSVKGSSTSMTSSGGSSVVTPFLSSFVKASIPAPVFVPALVPAPVFIPALVPAPVFVPALVPAPVFVPPPVFMSNRSSINNSSSDSSSSSSSSAAPSTTHSPPSYTECLVEYERAMMLSGLESSPLGDSCDFEDSDLSGKTVNLSYVSYSSSSSSSSLLHRLRHLLLLLLLLLLPIHTLLHRFRHLLLFLLLLIVPIRNVLFTYIYIYMCVCSRGGAGGQHDKPSSLSDHGRCPP